MKKRVTQGCDRILQAICQILSNLDPGHHNYQIKGILYKHHRQGGGCMEFKYNLGDKAIQDVMQTYPEIGEILNRFEIGCVTCKVGICLLKDVVSIHGLSKDDEAKIEQQINDYLTQKGE
jgi:hypothetical protein